MEPGARVCPFCGEPPGTGVFCAACGRNLAAIDQLPTRQEWEDASTPEPVGSPVALPAFVAAMHAAGDPGAEKVRRAAPGFLGRAQHTRGWVVRAVGRDEPGLFVSVEGQLHRLTSRTQGAGQRDEARYVDLVGPEVPDAAHDPRLGAELAEVLRANGLTVPA